MRAVTASLLLLAGTSTGTELTPSNWDEKTAGKSVFIKFQAPWCGHCKRMKPDWDKLMTEFADHDTKLVGDVDCTAAGKPLCDSNGVKGFPTLKWGDPADLQDYEGGRDFDSLHSHAEKKLTPQCSPKALDLCSDEKKAEIERLQALPEDDLAAEITKKEEELKTIEQDFKTAVEGLQKRYEEMQKEKDEKLEKIKDAGLGLMKAVKTFKNK